MIPRHTRPEMAAIWSPETRFRIWFKIEAHAGQLSRQHRRDPQRGGAGAGRSGLVATALRTVCPGRRIIDI
jgi:adenylosuccinate lyase